MPSSKVFIGSSLTVNRRSPSVARISRKPLMSGAMARLGKLVASETALFVCDIQERFRPVIAGMPAVIDTAKRMVRAAEVMHIPVVVTEQYPKALGPTVAELRDHLPPTAPVVAKTLFSMMVPEVADHLQGKLPHVKQVLIVGIEAHVCVLQTTLDLIERGYEVHVVVDGVSSQRLSDRGVALQRLAQSGAFLATSEMVCFQMMGSTQYPSFKAISALFKEGRADPLPAVTSAL